MGIRRSRFLKTLIKFYNNPHLAAKLMDNEKVRNIEIEILSNNWYTLKKVKYEYLGKGGVWENLSREAYDRGNGATILLYNKSKKSVILTRQFRMPTYLNGNENGYLIECCAGLLDKDNPEDCIKRETEEETGYKITDVKKVFEAYMSPGSVAEYSNNMKISDGGGAHDESENIEVLELSFAKALDMIKIGDIKDGKTIMLLQYAEINKVLS
jgi:GDP-mannose pyrophosphatase NudK